MKHINVVAGILTYKGHFLAVQRGHHKYDYVSLKWEFPGGKIEDGETPETALIRELNEELDIDISDLQYLTTSQHIYPDFQISLHCYVCPVADKNLTLHEHVDHRWLSLNELPHLDWTEADIPLINKLHNEW